MEIRMFSLVLLLVMCSALLTEAQSWKDFKNKHIFGKMTKNACTKVMNQKKLPGSGPYVNSCKERNTFIKATDQQVKAVCTGAGKPVGGKLYKSNLPFSVVTCTGNPNQRYPKCEYKGNEDTRKITITCENKLPVHYQEDKVVVG
ncbi:ribonuclease-like 3 precursor [Silurus asotus]|uniref:Ribonuclease-like 3 n=1 Tax=Silurus asotus TaxID=30991 RepID=A0AAD5FVS1_SILAS|nr:ribonuclease-like 3 precursor [Silurus asotus]